MMRHGNNGLCRGESFSGSLTSLQRLPRSRLPRRLPGLVAPTETAGRKLLDGIHRPRRRLRHPARILTFQKVNHLSECPRPLDSDSKMAVQMFDEREVDKVSGGGFYGSRSSHSASCGSETKWFQV